MLGASSERSSRGAVKLGPPLVVLLLLSVALASAWLAHQETEPPAPPLPGEVLDLPDFSATDHLVVVDGSNSSFEELLTLGCMQGLVNRFLSVSYLDREGEVNDPESLLNFVLWRYNLTHEVVTPDAFLINQSHFAKGLVVYDPEVPDTINVARTVAGLQDLLVVDPGRVAVMANLTGLDVKLDLREGKWKGLSDLDLYRKAFEDLYVSSKRRPLLGSRPEVELMTDYGVATKAFFFFLNPGPFTTPGEMSLFEYFLKQSEPGVPLLGWFDQPTGVEENYMVQKASAYGHFLVGGSRLPNFSLLTAYGRGDLTPPPAVASPAPVPELEATTYLSFAVTDGDNLEFFTRRGRHIWDQPQRGELPLAWSVSPALAELAPPLLERTYLEATANDTFIAGPSGLGYFYPGFLPDGHLEPLLERTRGLMDEAHLGSVWLLNSFTTYETPYDDGDIEVYVDQIGPSGILIDYGDVPVTEPFWQEDDTPVIRVFHLWGSVENLEAKLSLALNENDPTDTGQPYFVVVALMSIDFDLDEIQEVYNSLPDDVEVVALPEMFQLVEGHWEGRWANNRPLFSFLEDHGCGTVGQQYRCYSAERSAWDQYRLILLGIPLVLALELLVRCRDPKRKIRPAEVKGIFELTIMTGLWTLGLLLTDTLIHHNFWHYGWLGLAFLTLPLVLIGLGRLPEIFRSGVWTPVLVSSGLLAGVGLFGYHPAGFVLALPALAITARSHWQRTGPGPVMVLGGLLVALVVVNLPVEGYWRVWAASLVTIVGILNSVEGEDVNFDAPPLSSQVVAASGMVLATLPWYLDRSFFWSNHLAFHMTWLSDLGLVLPALAGLVLLGYWNLGSSMQRCEVLWRGPRLPPLVILLLAGILAYMAAGLTPVHLLSGYLLLMAEILWVGSACKALSGVEAARKGTRSGSFFLLVLALQAFMALWLTIPPVFYVAFVWPGMPVWANYLLYHTPLALAVFGLLVLLVAFAVRATQSLALREKTARKAG